MRHKQHLLTSFTIATSLLSATAEAQSGLGDVQAIKPVLMLVVDTSGSMERMPANGTCVDCLPSCSGNPATDATQKNRWTGAIEALTGNYVNYACTSQNRSTYPLTDYDYGYYLPHIAPLPTVTQTSDGLLDALQYTTKFGLMTFDGQGTYQDGEPLIDRATILGNSTISNWVGVLPSSGGASYAGAAQGMYSYGPLKTLTFQGCDSPYGMNLGVRGPGTHPGALVSVSASDDGATVRATNDAVQNALLTVRPYGGTPIAAALDDLNYWVENSPDVKSPADGGLDPFAQCRPKFAVLLTDGAPDSMFRDSRYRCDTYTGPCQLDDANDTDCCPYDTEANIAARLHSDPNKKFRTLYVVAFNVTDPGALATLDAVAVAGGETLKQAQTATELRTQLNSIFTATQPKATSRTVPVTVDGTGDYYVQGTKSFEIRAGFRPNQLPEDPWDGFLERTEIRCLGSSVDYVNEGESLGTDDRFHATLNATQPADRTLVTVRPSAPNVRGTLRSDSTSAFTGAISTLNNISPVEGGGSLLGTPPSPDSTTAANQGLWQAGLSADLPAFDTSMSPSYFGDATLNSIPGEAADLEKIVDFMSGQSRPNHKMSDIYHSQPAVLGPLLTRGVDRRLGAWRQLVAQHYSSAGGTRPQVVFVGTNDGFLHAFNLDSWNSNPAGKEFWAFAPPALFDKMHTVSLPDHQFMFDGDIIVKDMYVKPDSNPLLATRTILLAAVRGTPAYVALDVTYPEQPPKLLWQFSDPSLGDTTAKPALTQLAFEWTPGNVQQRAVAILPGGRGEENPSGPATCFQRGPAKPYGPSDARSTGRCWKNRGRVLFVVDIATGLVIQKFDQRHFPAPLTGSIGMEGSRDFGQSAFFTDEDGILWHLALDGVKADQWHVEPIWDVFHGMASNAGRPSLYAPIVTRDTYKNPVIILGTGDIDNVIDTNAKHRVVSLSQARTFNGDGTVSTVVKNLQGNNTFNWEMTLNPRESVTGPLTLVEGTVYFASLETAVSTNQCSLGTSYLYGVDYLSRDPNASPLPLPRLYNPNTNANELREAQATDEVVLGVNAGKDPICLSGAIQTNPYTGTSGFVASGAPSGSTFHVRANVGSMNGTTSSSNGTSIKLKDKTYTMSKATKVVGWAGSVE